MSGVIELTGEIYSYLTVTFPFKYIRDNRYIVVMYDCNINHILTQEIKNSEEKSIANSYETLYNRLTTKVLKPCIQKLYNEASKKNLHSKSSR